MFKKRDPSSFARTLPLYAASDEIGTLWVEYQVARYDDVQVQDATSVSKPKDRRYLVHCTQRINLYNASAQVIKPSTDVDSYENYPALIQASMSIGPADHVSLELQDYSPKTINTTVQVSGSTGKSDGSTLGSSSSQTVGSSTSQTNSYDASVSVGMNDSMSDPTNLGMSENSTSSRGHSTTTTQEQSKTQETSSSQSRTEDSSSSAGMSMKDWGAYAMVNPTITSPTWVFGQEYPWNAIDCRNTKGTKNPNNGAQVEIVVPTTMTARLYDSVCLYPPSQLSTFGVNFVMKSLWLVTIGDQSSSDAVTVVHDANYYAGSHALVDANVAVYLDAAPTSLNAAAGPALSTTIDLALMALTPATARGNATATGFSQNRFIVLPAVGTDSTPPVAFKIVSLANDLLAQDTTSYAANAGAAGFSLANSLLTANFTPNCSKITMTLYFKVIDTVKDYTLYLKHWKLGSNGVMLTLTINGDTSDVITKYIDAAEAEGGENNITAVSLRNQNYASINYHDYLQLGLNSIQIDIQPIGGQYLSDCSYQIRALSISAV